MEMIKQYAITEVPTIYLMSNDGSQATRVSTGLVSADELKNTIILAARGMNLLDEATFQNTLDSQNGLLGVFNITYIMRTHVVVANLRCLSLTKLDMSALQSYHRDHCFQR